MLRIIKFLFSGVSVTAAGSVPFFVNMSKNEKSLDSSDGSVKNITHASFSEARKSCNSSTEGAQEFRTPCPKI